MNFKDMSIDELKELQNDMYIKYNELCNLYDDCNYERKFKDNYELERKYKKLKKELSILEMKMREIEKNIFLKYEPITFNEKVDLRKETEELEGVYSIFLHNTNICIGETEYKGYHQFGGDMSVFIDKQYRGHGYAYEALRLLSDLLQKNGIGDFWLAVEKKNIPSLKTIEKYGGQVVSDFGPAALLYECKALSIDLEELIKLKQKLENDLEKCYEMKHNIYKKMEELKEPDDILKEKKQLVKRTWDIEENIGKIEELIYFKIPPLATNDIIDLRKTREHPLEDRNDNNLIGRYEIFLHNTNISVGGIDYRGYHFHEYFADVGGEIIKEYRGNGYLYQALSLLKELLSKKGIDDFWASANENNIPSIKTIKKLGGILLDSKSGTELYKVPTKKIELEEVSSKKM